MEVDPDIHNYPRSIQILSTICQRHNITFSVTTKVPYYSSDTEQLYYFTLILNSLSNHNIDRIRSILRMYCYIDTPSTHSPLTIINKFNALSNTYIRVTELSLYEREIEPNLAILNHIIHNIL